MKVHLRSFAFIYIVLIIISFSAHPLNKQTPVKQDTVDSNLDFLLIWQLNGQFIQNWLEQKKLNPESPIKALVKSHTFPSDRGLEVISQPALVIDSDGTDRRWLILAFRAYAERNFVDAEFALENISASKPKKLHDHYYLLKALLASKNKNYESAKSYFEKIGAESDILPIKLFNWALIGLYESKFKESLAILDDLTDSDNTSSTFLEQINLVRSYALGLSGEIEDFEEALAVYTNKHPLYEAALLIQAEVYLKTGNKSLAIAALLKLEKMSGSIDDKLPIKLFQQLKENGAIQQLVELGEMKLPSLLAYRKKLEKEATLIIQPDFVKKTMSRKRDNDSASLPANFSQATKKLIAEIETNNSLNSQLKSSLDHIKQYELILVAGLPKLANELKSFKSLLFRDGRSQANTLKISDPKIRKLENLITELVGEPSPVELRYQLLDGLSIWTHGYRFKQRWWFEDGTHKVPAEGQTLDQIYDYKEAQKALDVLLNIPRQETLLLLETHIQALMGQLTRAQKKTRLLINKLNEEKQELIEFLKPMLQQESQILLVDIEKKLLWLAAQNLANNELLTSQKTNVQFSLMGANNGDTKNKTVLVQTKVNEKPPKLIKTFQALNLLSEKAQSLRTKLEAKFLLANWHTKLGQRALTEGEADPSGIVGDFSTAVSLYRYLIKQESDLLDSPQLLYQIARVYDFTGQLKESLESLAHFKQKYQSHPLYNEVLFRSAELNFNFGDYDLAAQDYLNLLNNDSGEFSEKASYKLGWSHFKLGEYQKALEHFFVMVEKYWQFRVDGNEHEKRLLGDVLRVVSMTFGNLEGIKSVEQFFSNRGDKSYQETVYLDLARYYQRKLRYSDAAETYQSLVDAYPNSTQAPYYQTQIVQAYRDGGFYSKSWPAQEKYVSLFGGGSQYWEAASQEIREAIKMDLGNYLEELAQRDHARAQKTKLKKDYMQAIGWYQKFVEDMPKQERAAKMYYLLGQAHTEIEQNLEAVDAYQKSAYDFPEYNDRAQAAYAGLLALQKLYSQSEGIQKTQWLDKEIAFGKKFVENFSSDKNTPLVQTKLAEDYLIQDNHELALSEAQNLIVKINKNNSALQIRNWRVVAHASFLLNKFSTAENAYQILLTHKTEPEETTIFIQRLSESIYKQAEKSQAEGKLAEAVVHYKRVGLLAPNSVIHATAEFDLATLQMKMLRWQDAIDTLESFTTKFSGHKLQKTIPEKLVLAYEETQNWSQAAKYLKVIFDREGGSDLGRDALWRTAKLYEKSEQFNKAYDFYKLYLTTFPSPLESAMEAREQLVQMSTKLAQFKSRSFWLREIINQFDQAKNINSERSLYLASQSALLLGKDIKKELDAIRLNLPLDLSLGRKQKAMKSTFYYLNKTIKYRIADHSTEATLLVADIYADMAKELLAAPKPKTLNELELEQYNILLEDQAFPFEDKAIEFYELNVAQIKDDVYTPWIEKSLVSLRRLMPARYNKFEKVESYAEKIQ